MYYASFPSTSFWRLRNKFRSIWYVFVFLTNASNAQELRVWTDVQGRTIKASFVAVVGENVQLRLEGGAISTVPLARLSAPDKQYLAKLPQQDQTVEPQLTWPSDVAVKAIPEVTIVKEDAEKEEFVYETEHFEFRCNAKLGDSLVREFARLFEATYLANTQLPLNLRPKPEPGREKFMARLFKNKQEYFDAGAIPGSWGVYHSASQCLMVPMESLGVRQVGKRFTLDRNARNTTLIHETTHQMMNYWLTKIPTWYCEGSAEYMAAAKYKQGKFSFSRMGESLSVYLREKWGIGDKKLTIWHVHHTMQIDAESLAKAVGNDIDTSQRNYVSCAILTFYFYHLDGEGDARNFINYLKDLQLDTLQRLAAQRHLIRGRSYSEIEKELSQKMRRFGLELDFTGDAGPDSKDSVSPAPEIQEGQEESR